MTSKRNRADTQSDRILRCKICWCPNTTGDEITIFFRVDGQLIRRRIAWTQLSFTGNDDNISPSTVAIQIEGHSRVLRDMRQAFCIGAAIYEKGRCGLIPPEPHKRRLGRPLRIYSRQPDYTLVPQSAGYPFAKRRRRVWKLKWHRISSTFFKMIISGTKRSIIRLGRSTSPMPLCMITQ